MTAMLPSSGRFIDDHVPSRYTTPANAMKGYSGGRSGQLNEPYGWPGYPPDHPRHVERRTPLLPGSRKSSVAWLRPACTRVNELLGAGSTLDQAVSHVQF